MDTERVKSVIAAAVIIMISLAFYIPNVSAMDTAAREFETVCQRAGKHRNHPALQDYGGR